MVESRCGLKCSQCEYKEQMNCKGCININKPFWGDSCPVKTCCENKGHEHCGQCIQFPCSILKGFSYDKEQGDNGRRIEQCKKMVFKVKEILLEFIYTNGFSEYNKFIQKKSA